MLVRFLGTRGMIEARNDRHRRHTSALVESGSSRVLIDRGRDWKGESWPGGLDAVLVTHAHPDHAEGLEAGAPAPVWATDEAWAGMEGYGIEERRRVRDREAVGVAGLRVEAFAVAHSTRCPAVGYRIESGGASLFYVPDVVKIEAQSAALRGVGLYVGDGASVTRSLVRRSGEALVGHTTVRAQIGWCAEEGVGRAAFTHCGSGIVKGDERSIGPEVARMGEERGVEAWIAADGDEVEVGGA